jgi:4-amino-4-deoxy-L-arabinose transferase-like glycosyltransferase
LDRSGKIEIAVVVGFFLAALVIRGFNLNVLVAFPDDLTYASRTYQVIGQNWTWPLSQMWDQPPLMVYLLAVVMTFFGGALNTLRWLSVVAGSLSVVVSYFLAKSMYGRKAGLVAAFALTINGFAILYSRLIYIEALAALLILGATYFFWEGLVKKRDLKMAILGGVVYGLALDSKYVSLVMGVALVLFLLLYHNKFREGFPGREALAFFGVAFLCFLPVLLDLAVNNVNPFYWDLVYRFQIAKSNSFAGQVASGRLITVGFTHFVQLLFHVSSTVPFQVFPLLWVDIPIWTVLVGMVGAFFLLAFLARKSPSDGLLFLLFIALLAFAFLYPDRRTYFLIYPAVIFFVMLGRVAQLSADRFFGGRNRVVAAAAVIVLAMTVTGLAVNSTAVPAMYQGGFGDWDEIQPIVNYIAANHSPNSYVATSRLEVGVYLALDNVNVSLAYMRQPANYYSQPVLNQTLMTPYIGIYPTFWVISSAVIEKTHPQFIVISQQDYLTLTAEFQRFIAQRYYQPLSTSLVYLFQIRPGSAPS